MVKYQQLFRTAWDALNIGVISVNSFILLLYRNTNKTGMEYVICAGATIYILILLAQTILFRKSPVKQHELLYQTKNAFRLIYTAFYLTVIMLDVIAVTAQTDYGNEKILSYYGFLFIWVSLWGTNFLWLRKVAKRIKEVLKDKKAIIISKENMNN